METFMPAPGKNYKGPMLPQFVLKKEITFGAKVMYAILCDCASHFKADNCYPSHSTLAERLSCSVSSVKRYLSELTRAKLIRVEHRERHSNRYYMLRPDTLKSVAPHADIREPDAAQPLQTVRCEPEAERQQSTVTLTQPKVDYAQSKVSYITNLNKKPEENTNPPLPPAPVPRSVPPASRPVGGGGSFFSDFEKLWEAYPRKDAKGAAEQAYKRLLRIRQCPPLPELLAAFKRFACSEKWQRENGRFIPYLSNFLNHRRWLDPLSDEEAEANRKRLEAEQRELARKREQEAEEARRTEKKQRLRPIFDAFAERFEDETWKSNARLDAMLFGTWMHSYGQYAGPTAADVPSGADADIKDFLDSYKRQRAAETYRAAHLSAQPTAHRATVTARDSYPDNRERKLMNCSEILHNGNFLARLIPAWQPVCAAV